MSHEERPPALRAAPAPAGHTAWIWERTRWPADRLAQGLLDAMQALLAVRQPAQVEPSTTLAFGAGDEHVVLLPHRDLPLALVVRLRGRKVELGWAGLRSDLRSADVAALSAARRPVTLAHPDAGQAEVLRALEEELQRPIELRLTWAEGQDEPLAVELWVGGARLVRRARWNLRAALRLVRLQATARELSLSDRERAPVALYGREGWTSREPGWGPLRPPPGGPGRG